jgi:hypothetical protein
MSMYARATCVAACLIASACSKSSTPAQPSSNSSGGGSATVTVPRLVAPASGGLIRNVDQPVTLTIGNAVLTQGATPTYTFEVSTDSAFGSKAFSKSGVAQGTNGQTSLKIDPIGAGADYYWRARAEGGGTVGPYAPAQRFTIGPAVTIGQPQLLLPAQAAAAGSLQAFSVTNAPRTGPAGPLRYRFEVSTSNSFPTRVVDVTVPEGVGRTIFQPTVELPAETTLFWRVTAIDDVNGLSTASDIRSFVTSLAIDLHKVVYLNSPDVSNWPRTATLTLVEQDGGGEGPVCMQYTDPGWPDSDWPFDNVSDFGVYANQWYFARIGGVWYGGAGEWIYRGASSCKAGQGTRTIGPDAGFGEPFRSWVPKVGELVGFMVSSVARQGPVRRTVDERSNVIVQPWRDTSLGSKSSAFGFRP